MRCRARYDAEPDGEGVPPATMTLPDGTRLHTGDADVNARLSELVGREVTLWPLQPAENREHYRRGLPDNPDFETELRQMFGRLPDEPLPDLTGLPPELFEYTSPLGTYFDAFAGATCSPRRRCATLAAHNPQAAVRPPPLSAESSRRAGRRRGGSARGRLVRPHGCASAAPCSRSPCPPCAAA